MVDTTTTVLGLVKQTIGGNRNTWGIILNNCMDLIEGAFYGMTSMVVTGAGDVTLTDSERRKRILVFTGTLAADQTIIVANLVGRWTVRNATTGNFALKFKTASGTAVTVPQSGNCNVWCDGSDNFYADLSTYLRDVQVQAPSGSDDVPGYGFANEKNSGLRRVSLGLLAVIIGGVRVVTIAGTALRVAITDAGMAITGALAVSGAVTCSSLTVGGTTPTPIGGGMDYDGVNEPNGWKFRNGQALSRTTYSALLNALTITCIGNVHLGNSGVEVDQDLRGKGLLGARIEGLGIPSGTVINVINASSLGLSVNGTGDNFNQTLRIFPHGNGDGAITFNVPDDRGRINPGRDDMGGTAANRLTGQPGGIDGTKLGAVGGEERVTITQANLPAATLATNIPAGQGLHNHSVTVTGGGSFTNILAGNENGIGNIPTSSNTLPAMSGTTALGGSSTPVNNVQPGRITNKIIFTGVYT